jgi:uncharacterized protein (TIGR02391 family)
VIRPGPAQQVCTVRDVDTEWMREKLEEYLDLCKEYEAAYKATHGWNPECEQVNDRAEMALPTVTRILEALRVMPDRGKLLPPSYSTQNDTDRAVKQGLGVLRDQEEWSTRLTPQAPTLSADQFHPWVWNAAAPFWDAGQSAAAVEYGAKSLTARIQQKSGSRLADREVASDVFSPKPHAKNARLWLPGQRDTDTWKSRQDGLHHLAMGAYAGIRNVVTHSVEPGWSEQEALEYLAVLSTVARWVEETEVVTPTAAMDSA